MGLKFESDWIPWSYLGGPTSNSLFVKFSDFFGRNTGPLLKNNEPNPKFFFVLERGYPGATTDLDPP